MNLGKIPDKLLYKGPSIGQGGGSAVLSGTGNIDKVGRYGGARVYIPSKVAFDSTLPFKMGEEVKIQIDPEMKTLLILPANDQRSLTVIETRALRELSTELRHFISLFRDLPTELSNRPDAKRQASRIERKLDELVLA